MPDLPPLARISAAIEKLERLKAESTPGTWAALAYLFAPVHGDEEVRIDTPEVDSDRNVAESVTPADADLIVTLHRTIPVLLLILKPALAEAQSQGDAFSIESCDEPSAMQDALELSEAILGGES